MKKYLIPGLILLALAAATYHYKKSHCGPCKEKAVIIKKGKVPYSKELQRNFMRAKQAAAAVKATGFMPRFS